jgi:subtilase family serine protease
MAHAFLSGRKSGFESRTLHRTDGDIALTAKRACLRSRKITGSSPVYLHLLYSWGRSVVVTRATSNRKTASSIPAHLQIYDFRF